MVNREEIPEKKTNLRHWVVVDVNNLIEVPDNDFGDRCKLFEVKGPFWGDIHVEGNGCQVTHSNLRTNHIEKSI